MKILMANKYLYPRAGAETYMITVAEQLLAAGHQVSFFGMAHPDNTTLGPTATLPFLEFGRHQSPLRLGANITRAASHQLTGHARRLLADWVDTWQPDLIHAHNIYNQLPPDLFRDVRHDVPVLMTLHDYKPICPNYSLFANGSTCTRCVTNGVRPCITHRCVRGNLIASSLAAVSARHHRKRQTYDRDYHHYVSPSGFVRDRMIDGGLPADRIDVIPNFAPIPEAATPPGQGLFYGGRLCIEKGVDILLQGYAQLTHPRPPFRIAGDGPLASELKALATELGLDETVTWLGRIPPVQIRDELERTFTACVPSTWFENCSIAIMESLAQGRPVLASNAGGNPDLVRPGIDGEIFTAGDSDSCRDALARLLAHPDPTALGEAARQAALARFSPDVHLRQLLQAYATTQSTFANTKTQNRKT